LLLLSINISIEKTFFKLEANGPEFIERALQGKETTVSQLSNLIFSTMRFLLTI
jgi:hypothetical protein